jgi:hypothetical protein
MSQLEQDIELLVNNAQAYYSDEESQEFQDAAMLQVCSSASVLLLCEPVQRIFDRARQEYEMAQPTDEVEIGEEGEEDEEEEQTQGLFIVAEGLCSWPQSFSSLPRAFCASVSRYQSKPFFCFHL